MSEWEDHCGEQGCEICCGNVMDPATVQTEVEAMRAKLKQASVPPNALLPTEEPSHDQLVAGEDASYAAQIQGLDHWETARAIYLAMRALAKPDEGVGEEGQNVLVGK